VAVIGFVWFAVAVGLFEVTPRKKWARRRKRNLMMR